MAVPSPKSGTDHVFTDPPGRDELADFRRQCERQLRRSVPDRIRFGFFRNPDPVREAGLNRSFSSMREYRRFCAQSYPLPFDIDLVFAPDGIESFDKALRNAEHVKNFPVMALGTS